MLLDPDDEKIIADCKAAGVVLITWDRVLRQAAGGVTPYEALELAKEKAEQDGDSAGAQKLADMRRLSPAELTATRDQADSTYAHLSKIIVMHEGMASLVHDMRVEEDYSWRAVARAVAAITRVSWGGNQIAGLVLCEKAAQRVGQDFMAPPWN